MKLFEALELIKAARVIAAHSSAEESQAIKALLDAAIRDIEEELE